VTAANPFLERYYLDRGFQRVGFGEIRGELRIFLERTIGC